MIFTASVPDYADWIINQIDPQGLIEHRLYRHHTTFKDGMFVYEKLVIAKLHTEKTSLFLEGL